MECKEPCGTGFGPPEGAPRPVHQLQQLRDIDRMPQGRGAADAEHKAVLESGGATSRWQGVVALQ